MAITCPILVTLYQRSLELCVYFWAFLSHAVTPLGGVPVCESGRPKSGTWQIPVLSQWGGRVELGSLPPLLRGSLPRGRGVPFRQCHLALAENDFSDHLHPVGSVSFSVHQILFFWSLAVPAGARTRRGGWHGETRQCRPSPHGPHSVEKNSYCHLLTVPCVLFLSPLTTAFEAEELCKLPLAR